MQDVLNAVVVAKDLYDTKHQSSKVGRYVVEFSKRLCYYGNIMDVLVQHHPEYVALAWGAMKIAFTVRSPPCLMPTLLMTLLAIVEHEKLGTTIVNGLCDVADALPRIELASILYPTTAMKQSIATLYAHILKFLVRALDWYDEGKIKHAIQSITKPAALRYNDIVSDIHRATESITKLAAASSQAEQRDMHSKLHAIHSSIISANENKEDFQTCLRIEVNALAAIVRNLQESLLMDQSINTHAPPGCHQGVSDIQLTQALSTLSSSCNIDHKSSIQTYRALRNRHRHTARSKCVPFWAAPELHAWDTSSHSSLMTLKATWSDRLYVRDFTANMIDQLSEAQVAVLWILKNGNRREHPIDILISLVYQTLALDKSLREELHLSFQIRKYLTSCSEEDYASMLTELLDHFKLVYVVLNADAMTTDCADQCSRYLRSISQEMNERGSKTVLKVIIVSCSTKHLSTNAEANIVLKVGSTSRPRRKKMPAKPLGAFGGNAGQSGRGKAPKPSQTVRRSSRAVQAV